MQGDNNEDWNATSSSGSSKYQTRRELMRNFTNYLQEADEFNNYLRGVKAHTSR